MYEGLGKMLNISIPAKEIASRVDLLLRWRTSTILRRDFVLPAKTITMEDMCKRLHICILYQRRRISSQRLL